MSKEYFIKLEDIFGVTRCSESFRKQSQLATSYDKHSVKGKVSKMKVLRMLTILLSIILSMLEFVVLVHAGK